MPGISGIAGKGTARGETGRAAELTAALPKPTPARTLPSYVTPSKARPDRAMVRFWLSRQARRDRKNEALRIDRAKSAGGEDVHRRKGLEHPAPPGRPDGRREP